MDKHMVYCDECVFLEERPVLAEVPMDSGNYVKTGTRFYCLIHKKWFVINTTMEQMRFNYCASGMKRENVEDCKLKSGEKAKCFGSDDRN